MSQSLERFKVLRYEVTSMETGVGVEVFAAPEKGVSLCERRVLTVRKQHGLGHPSKHLQCHGMAEAKYCMKMRVYHQPEISRSGV
jgi:hypothetical protein